MKPFFLLFLLAIPAYSVFFWVNSGSRRCVLEEVPDQTLVMGKYVSPDQLPTAPLQVSVTNPQGEIVLMHECEKEGRFAFTSHSGGEHQICITPLNTSPDVIRYNFSLVLEVGDSAMDYSEIARLEHLSAIELQIRRLNDKIRAMRAESKYQRLREEEFLATSEITNSRVLWLTLGQTVILIGSGVAQLMYLKRFFQSKKLV